MACQYMSVRQFILLLMLAVFVSRYASAQPTKVDLEEAYMKRRPGQEVCVFSAQLCRRGEEYCSSKTRSCHSLYPRNVTTDSAKRDYCTEKVNNTATEPAVYDNCVYFIGTMEIKRAGCAKPVNESDIKKQHHVHEIGKEFCPYNNLYCQPGKEYCNPATRQCEQLFPDNASDKDKWEWCQEVFNKNLTVYRDSCFFICGTLHCQKNIINDESTKDSITGLTIGVIIIGIVLLAVVIGVIVLVLKLMKLACFKQDTQNTQTQNRNHKVSAEPVADDLSKYENKDKKKLQKATTDDDEAKKPLNDDKNNE